MKNIPNAPCIFAANHQGVWESFFLQTINIPTSSIIKRELLLIPFFGWALACLKPIHLRRSNKFKSLKTVINKGSKKLSNNTSLIIFPEGTRSLPQNGLKNFSSSCGVLSIKNNVPVIPICHNSGLFWKNKKFNKEPGIIKVRIGPPICGENPKSIAKEVKDWIQSSFEEIH
jgi:1-acyl-sn-glycerol-3-phosphate acyltransferase